MNARFASLGLIAALMPLAVEIPYDSTASDGGTTRVRVAEGVGTYAFIARGCEGQVVDEVPAQLMDAGVSLEHEFAPTPLVVGVRGGWVRHEIETPRKGISGFPGVPVGSTVENRWVNPYIASEGEEAGIGIGPVFHRREFITAGEGAREQTSHPFNDVSWHLRRGARDGRHFTVQWMEGVPLASGGGYFTALLAEPLPDHPEWLLQGGLGAGGPQEGAGLVLRLEHIAPVGVSLDVTGRLGFSGNRFAGGAALGLSYAMSPGRKSRPAADRKEAATDHE